MPPLRILCIVHNHPALHAGGTEIFAHELFEELNRSGSAEAFFLAATNELHRQRRPGTAFQTIDRAANEMLLWAGHFDLFNVTQVDIEGTFIELAELLQSFRPDIVHFQHVLLFGIDALAVVRKVCPHARIVLTLHDYYPICHRDGIMLKAESDALCERASPGACHRCFPDRSPAAFRLREINLKHHLRLADRLLAPSSFLRERYVAWGIEPARIEVMRNGRKLAPPVPPRALEPGGMRNSFALFGNISPSKGTLVALNAARQLAHAGGPDFSLAINGSPAFQGEAFKEDFQAALAALGPIVQYGGKYVAADVPARMRDVDWVIVPSIWWENAPLVIEEAFHNRRPVICSALGGMAERVSDGIDGLLFEPGNSASLMRAMQRAKSEPALWQRLSDAITPVRSIEQCAADHLDLYRRLLGPETMMPVETQPLPTVGRKRRRSGPRAVPA